MLDSQPLPTPAATGLDLGPMLSYLGASALVIGLLVAGAFLLRHGMRHGWRHRAHQRSLRTLDVLPLPGRGQLAVVQVYDRTLVLGLHSSGVRLLTEWDADGPLPNAPAPREEPEQARSQPQGSRRASARALLDMLGVGTQRAPTTPAQSQAAGPGADFEAILESALSKAVQAGQRTAAPAKRRRAESLPEVDLPKVPRQPEKVASAARTERAPRPETAAVAPAVASRRGPTIDQLLRSEGVLG